MMSHKLGDVDLTHLSESERDTILRVLERDDDIRDKEVNRVRTLRSDIKALRLQGVIKDGVDADKTCARCRKPFGWFFNKGTLCPRCQHKICDTCKMPGPDGEKWMCTLCHKQMELEAMSGTWFYMKFRKSKRHKKSNRPILGNELVKSSFKRSHRQMNGTATSVNEEVKRVLSSNNNASPKRNGSDAEPGESSDTQSMEAVSPTRRRPRIDDHAAFPRDADKALLMDLIGAKPLLHAPPRAETTSVEVKRVSSQRYASDSSSEDEVSNSAPSSPQLSVRTDSMFDRSESVRSSLRSTSAQSSEGRITLVTDNASVISDISTAPPSMAGGPLVVGSSPTPQHYASTSSPLSDSVIDNPSHSSQLTDDHQEPVFKTMRPRRDSSSSSSSSDDEAVKAMVAGAAVAGAVVVTNRTPSGSPTPEPSPQPNRQQHKGHPDPSPASRRRPRGTPEPSPNLNRHKQATPEPSPRTQRHKAADLAEPPGEERSTTIITSSDSPSRPSSSETPPSWGVTGALDPPPPISLHDTSTIASNPQPSSQSNDVRSKVAALLAKLRPNTSTPPPNEEESAAALVADSSPAHEEIQTQDDDFEELEWDEEVKLDLPKDQDLEVDPRMMQQLRFVLAATLGEDDNNDDDAKYPHDSNTHEELLDDEDEEVFRIDNEAVENVKHHASRYGRMLPIKEDDKSDSLSVITEQTEPADEAPVLANAEVLDEAVNYGLVKSPITSGTLTDPEEVDPLLALKLAPLQAALPPDDQERANKEQALREWVANNPTPEPVDSDDSMEEAAHKQQVIQAVKVSPKKSQPKATKTKEPKVKAVKVVSKNVQEDSDSDADWEDMLAENKRHLSEDEYNEIMNSSFSGSVNFDSDSDDELKRVRDSKYQKVEAVPQVHHIGLMPNAEVNNKSTRGLSSGVNYGQGSVKSSLREKDVKVDVSHAKSIDELKRQFDVGYIPPHVVGKEDEEEVHDVVEELKNDPRLLEQHESNHDETDSDDSDDIVIGKRVVVKRTSEANESPKRNGLQTSLPEPEEVLKAQTHQSTIEPESPKRTELQMSSPEPEEVVEAPIAPVRRTRSQGKDVEYALAKLEHDLKAEPVKIVVESPEDVDASLEGGSDKLNDVVEADVHVSHVYAVHREPVRNELVVEDDIQVSQISTVDQEPAKDELKVPIFDSHIRGEDDEMDSENDVKHNIVSSQGSNVIEDVNELMDDEDDDDDLTSVSDVDENDLVHDTGMIMDTMFRKPASDEEKEVPMAIPVDDHDDELQGHSRTRDSVENIPKDDELSEEEEEEFQISKYIMVAGKHDNQEEEAVSSLAEGSTEAAGTIVTQGGVDTGAKFRKESQNLFDTGYEDEEVIEILEEDRTEVLFVEKSVKRDIKMEAILLDEYDEDEDEDMEERISEAVLAANRSNISNSSFGLGSIEEEESVEDENDVSDSGLCVSFGEGNKLESACSDVCSSSESQTNNAISSTCSFGIDTESQDDDTHVDTDVIVAKEGRSFEGLGNKEDGNLRSDMNVEFDAVQVKSSIEDLYTEGEGIQVKSSITDTISGEVSGVNTVDVNVRESNESKTTGLNIDVHTPKSASESDVTNLNTDVNVLESRSTSTEWHTDVNVTKSLSGSTALDTDVHSSHTLTVVDDTPQSNFGLENEVDINVSANASTNATEGYTTEHSVANTVEASSFGEGVHGGSFSSPPSNESKMAVVDPSPSVSTVVVASVKKEQEVAQQEVAQQEVVEEEDGVAVREKVEEDLEKGNEEDNVGAYDRDSEGSRTPTASASVSRQGSDATRDSAAMAAAAAAGAGLKKTDSQRTRSSSTASSVPSISVTGPETASLKSQPKEGTGSVNSDSGGTNLLTPLRRFKRKENDVISGSTESMTSFYSDAGEGNYGKVPVTGEIQFWLHYNYRSSQFEVHIKQCKGVAAVDPKKKRSDPYVKSYLLPDRTKNGKRKTRVKKHSLNPVFDETLKYTLTKSELETRTLWIAVWHHDSFGRNDFLGEVNVPLDYYEFSDTPNYAWHKLQERNPTPLSLLTYKGDLNMSLKYVTPENVSSSRKVKGRSGNKGELHILVKQARNLTAVRANGSSDPFVKGYLLPEKGTKAKQKTQVVKRNCNPDWNHTFVFEDVAWEELRERSLELTIWDHDRFTSNDFLGGVRLGLGIGKSYGKEVEWNDAKGEEISSWQSMLDHPNYWIQATLLLRPNMDRRK